MTATKSTAGKDTLQLTSSAFRQGDIIPVQYTCEGEDLSPPLEWSGAPLETRSFALICDDPDAPRGTWVHWMLYNLPGDAIRLETGVPVGPELPSGARQGLNDSGDLGYGGPCPPPGYLHRYFFRLHALDSMLGLPAGLHRADLEKAMSGHILAQGSLMGTFQRHRSSKE
jgi:Raf kinase inhibitor-like YbhB/YbcL family protein